MESKTKNANKNKSLCEKCQKNNSKVFNRNKFLCLDCFSEIIIHRFKANLRTCCKIRHEDYILVCISGGNISMSMLEMFKHSFDESKSNKKLFFKLKVLYIDDSILLSDKEKIVSARLSNKKLIEQILLNYKFDYQIINLENILKINNSDFNFNNNETDMNLIEQYLKIYNKIPNKGGFRKKFIDITIRNLIFFYAIKNNFKKIFFGNNGQGIANSNFFDIITGNGKDIKHSTTHVDNSYLKGKIEIYRPLQDFFNKEILYFNHYNKVKIIYPSYKDENLTIILSNFFEGLQNLKINTVPSVINTSEKVVEYKNENEEICKFCLSNMDKTKNLLEFGLDSALNNQDCVLNKELCYGCRRIFSEVIKDYFEENKKESCVKIINEILNIFKILYE